MALDPRRQQELKAWQRKAQTGALNDKQELRMNYLQNRQGAQPQQGSIPQAGRMGNQRLLPRNTRIQNPSDAQHYGSMVQNQQAQDNLKYGMPNLQQGIGGSREQGYDPATGQTFVRDSLSPEQQALYDSGNRLSQAGIDQAFEMLNNQNGGFDPQRQKIEDSVFNNLMRSTNQQKALEQKQLDELLAQRGIPVGSELYNNQMQQFNQRYDEMTANARDRATQFGGEEWSRRQNIANQLSGMGPGMRSPNLQGFQGTQVQYNDPLASQIGLQDQRLKKRQVQIQQAALNRVGGGGDGRSKPQEPESPFYA